MDVEKDAGGGLSALTDVLERAFESLHGIKWDAAAFSVRACWTDAWLTATSVEREACAKVAESWATAETATTCANIAEAIRRSNT